MGVSDPETSVDRDERHANEVEESQKGLRDSIAHTNKLLTESERMLERHRRERAGDRA